jgi:hypothetical protein
MLLVLLACNTDVHVTSAPESASTQTRLGISDDDAALILDFLNDCDTTFDVLDASVGLDRDAATNLIEARNGLDGECGTKDDTPFATLDDVDNVGQVGDRTIEDILYYVLGGANGTGTWEGVSFSEEEQEAVLELVNEASMSKLDEDVGLASDAAENIIDARPIDSMSELAGVSQVGEAALEALRDYVSQGGG